LLGLGSTSCDPCGVNDDPMHFPTPKGAQLVEPETHADHHDPKGVAGDQ